MSRWCATPAAPSRLVGIDEGAPPHGFPRPVVDVARADAWVTVSDHGNALEVVVGRRGTRVHAAVASRRLAWRLAAIEGRVEVLGVYPVRELLTHRVGTVVASLERVLVPAEIDAVRRAAATVTEVDHPTLAGTVWSAAFPLLRPAVERGATIDTVPGGLDPLLRAGSVRAGTRRLLGRPTRPLVRSVARRLLPAGDGPPVLAPLVLASMAVGACGPERLEQIVGTDPAHDLAERFTSADVGRARQVFAGRRPAVVADLLTSALVDAGAFDRLIGHLAEWSPPAPARPTAPPVRPAPPPVRPAPPPVRPAPPPPRRAQPRARRRAPDQPIEHPPTWLDAEGGTVAGYTVVLPWTTGELARWGRALGNCLDSYGDAVASGRSRLLGLRRDGALCFAVEVTPGGTIRQIEGPSNSQPPKVLGRQIARELVRLGIAHADGRTGRSLLAP